MVKKTVKKTNRGRANQKRARTVVMKPKQKLINTVKGYGPHWLRAAIDPFDHPPARIPDDAVQNSMALKSQDRIIFSTANDIATTTFGAMALFSALPGANPANAARIYSAYSVKQSDNTLGTVQLVSASVIPNFQAVFPSSGSGNSFVTPDDYKYRPTAFGLRITPRAPELYRGGTITVGLIEPDYSPNDTDVWKLAFADSPGNLTGAAFGTARAIQRMTRFQTFRIEDGTIEVESIPSGVPKYTIPTVSNGTAVYTMTPYVNTLPLICLIIEGDTTAVAGTTGNSFVVDIVRHYEVIPPSELVVAAGSEASPYNAAVLGDCLNNFASAYKHFPARVMLNEGRTPPLLSDRFKQYAQKPQLRDLVREAFLTRM